MLETKSSDNRLVYTVSELNQDVRLMLETGFPSVWLEGEISNFTVPSSGHWYFSLKDSKAQVRCAMFKGRCKLVTFTPKQGDKVLVKANISLYEARGEYQLIIDSMEEAGFGALQRQFDELKRKLQAEGLFSQAAKQQLPWIPQHIGVITSPTGAAIRDVLTVLKRRFPAVPVILYPTLVQGDMAAPQIAQTIAKANQHNVCDVLILTRGGGSLEDLWAFNEEVVARAIFHSQIPIVSAVGHEIDVTIADFVADKRAPTPSAAAEMVVPDAREILQLLANQQRKLQHLMRQQIKHQQAKLTLTARRLKHPSQQLIEFSQKLDNLEIRLHQSLKRFVQTKKIQFKQQTRMLQLQNPLRLIALQRSALNRARLILFKQTRQLLINKRSLLILNAKTLNTISPLATLSRGYSIVSQRNNNCIVRSYDEVKINDELNIQLHHGKILCTVKITSAD